ncbi:MAG TPA: nuclear transport factor 2 family protein [Anaerolineales bacterium]|nr:nuclear transport factor 2 family protein [Anaerolineales bacterium]
MDQEVYDFLVRHLKSIQENNISAYHETTASDLTLYEWWVTPNRIEGLPFHEFMMTSNARNGTVFGSDVKERAETRFDLANLCIQRYGGTAIASYTLLTSTASAEGVQVVAHQESRVMVQQAGQWKVVHVHKSPAWPAPHVPPK